MSAIFDDYPLVFKVHFYDVLQYLHDLRLRLAFAEFAGNIRHCCGHVDRHVLCSNNFPLVIFHSLILS